MDEGSTGLGRLGTHFWGFQKTSIIPDIITITKGTFVKIKTRETVIVISHF